jgi:hypothetical protein
VGKPVLLSLIVKISALKNGTPAFANLGRDSVSSVVKAKEAFEGYFVGQTWY